jgi:GDP-L-fucose synthase
MREFLHSDDLAAACLHLLASYDEDVAINVGTGIDIPISELANQIKAVTGYQGSINWDTSKPDGTMRKVLDVSKLKQSGWVAQISLVEGLQRTYEDYKSSLT